MSADDRQATTFLHITTLEELEDARGTGILTAWEELMDSDPTATLLQGPVWCMEWYRCYQDQFSPLVLVATCQGALVGLVPLAIERGTRRLVFAGDNMADYRDVVAMPEHRRTLVAELLSVFRPERFDGPFRVGPTHPESPTTGMIGELSGAKSGIRVLQRAHPCWRLELNGDGKPEEVLRKKSVKQTLKHYQRQGSVSLDVIRTVEQWDAVKDEFYDLHSLRQLQVERPVSFDDPRKRALYDNMLRDNPSAVHICLLRVDGRLVAGHYGCRRDGVVYWGLPVHDIAESKRSPGMVLIALLLQSAHESGLRGIDFTLGTEDYKARCGNRRVMLPTAEVYRVPSQFHARRVRDAAVNGAKRIASHFGDETWDRARDHVARVGGRVSRARELGALGTMAAVASRLSRKAWSDDRGLIFTVTPDNVRDVAPRLAPGETLSVSHNDPRVFLTCRDTDRDTRQAILEAIQGFVGSQREPRSLHALLIDGALAGWGWSYWPLEPSFLPETSTRLDFEEDSVSLYGFYILPTYRGRGLYPALLAAILNRRFSEGAQQAYITCLDTNEPSRRGIVATGFRIHEIHEMSRRLWSTSQKRLGSPGGGRSTMAAVNHSSFASIGPDNPQVRGGEGG